MTDDELLELLESADSMNTKRQIQYAILIYEQFATFTGKTLSDVNSLSDDELDKYLAKFFTGLRKADGDLYTKKLM